VPEPFPTACGARALLFTISSFGLMPGAFNHRSIAFSGSSWTTAALES
jgi:hypothetical protein